jgi:hypothetical protein
MILNLHRGLEAPLPQLNNRGTPPSSQPKTSGLLAVQSEGQPLEMYLLPPMETAAMSLRSLYAAIRKQLVDE